MKPHLKLPLVGRADAVNLLQDGRRRSNRTKEVVDQTRLAHDESALVMDAEVEVHLLEPGTSSLCTD